MEPVFVRAVFNLDCRWEGLDPVYRIYVNNEMFAERTYRWTDCYLEEHLQISAPPGTYRIRVEPVGPQIAKFITGGHRIDHGPAHWVDINTLEIRP
jgi:hypothetical protein